MNIKETFLSLITRTYPHGTESDLFHLLPQDLEIDEFGNLFKQIGDNPSTMFACHLDTATAALSDVKHVFQGNVIKTDGTSILGADDKAGVTILMYLMEKNIPGLYYFFLGEEVGCLGSKKVAEKHKQKPLDYIKKVVSFDRRGTTSIITHQCSSRCCSDNFGTALAEALNSAGLKVDNNDQVFDYKNDPTGLYTDSAQFTKIYPECTNISVGYQSEHTFNEQQNIKHLEKLAQAATLVDWESLPVERDPSKVEYRDYVYGSLGSYGRYGWDDDDYDYGYRPSKVTYEEKIWFVDEEFGKYVSYIEINKWTKKVLKADISFDRRDYESELIGQFLMSIDVECDTFSWDGFNLKVTYSVLNGGHITNCDRNDLAEFVPELDFWKEFQYESSPKKSAFDTYYPHDAK